MLKNKKAGMSLSVVLLVVLTMLICIVALFTFNARETQRKDKFSDLTVLDSFYSDAEIFDFYIYTLAKEVASTKPVSSEDFIYKFQMAYLKYHNLASLPAEASKEDILNQVKNNSKYEVSIATRTEVINKQIQSTRIIKFNLKDFDFSKNYSDSKSSAIKKLSFSHNITFEIAE
jgi:hypothetical protein